MIYLIQYPFNRTIFKYFSYTLKYVLVFLYQLLNILTIFMQINGVWYI